MQDLLSFLADKKHDSGKQRACCQHRVQHAFSCSRECPKDGTDIRTFQELLEPANLQIDLISAMFPGCNLLGMHNPLDW